MREGAILIGNEKAATTSDMYGKRNTIVRVGNEKVSTAEKETVYSRVCGE